MTAAVTYLFITMPPCLLVGYNGYGVLRMYVYLLGLCYILKDPGNVFCALRLASLAVLTAL